jgi:hypothetical protein
MSSTPCLYLRFWRAKGPAQYQPGAMPWETRPQNPQSPEGATHLARRSPMSRPFRHARQSKSWVAMGMQPLKSDWTATVLDCVGKGSPWRPATALSGWSIPRQSDVAPSLAAALHTRAFSLATLGLRGPVISIFAGSPLRKFSLNLTRMPSRDKNNPCLKPRALPLAGICRTFGAEEA